MNTTDARLLELALKKQRLQFTSEQHRHQFTRHTAVILPLCAGFDRIHHAWRWVRERPAIPVAIAVALLVGRPRAVLRWARRGFVGWQMWQRARRLVASALNG